MQWIMLWLSGDSLTLLIENKHTYMYCSLLTLSNEQMENTEGEKSM